MGQVRMPAIVSEHKKHGAPQDIGDARRKPGECERRHGDEGAAKPAGRNIE
jgi:hypothetical protein